MTTSDPEVYARVLVSGKFDPLDLTTFLGIEPTEFWRSDDVLTIGKGSAKWRFDGWALTSPADSDMDWPKKLTYLLRRLEPVKKKLLEYTKNHRLEIEVQCVAYTDDRVPVSWFSKSLLKQIVTFEASLDLDLYVLGQEEKQPSPREGPNKTRSVEP